MPAKYRPLSKLPTPSDDNGHNYTTCPFCDKGLRKDNFPGHLKTELAKLEVVDADGMEEYLTKADPNSIWSSLGTINILVETTQTASGTHQYHRGVCFDCHRIVLNKPTTLSSTEVFEEHSCEYRKNKKKLELETKAKPDTIEHIKTKTPVVLSDEARVMKATIKACELVVSKFPSLTTEQRAELTYECKKVKENYTEQEDIMLNIYKETLRYFVPKIKKNAPTNWLTDLTNETAYVKHFDGYETAEDIQDRIREALDIAIKSEEEKEDERQIMISQITEAVRNEADAEIRELQDQVAQLKTELKFAIINLKTK
jgi:hypothetical protein